MFNQVFGLYHQIINIILHLLVLHITKDQSHNPLIGSTSVLQSERHHFVEVIHKKRPKGGFIDIYWLHKDLIVATIAIHKGKAFLSSNYK